MVKVTISYSQRNYEIIIDNIPYTVDNYKRDIELTEGEHTAYTRFSIESSVVPPVYINQYGYGTIAYIKVKQVGENNDALTDIFVVRPEILPVTKTNINTDIPPKVFLTLDYVDNNIVSMSWDKAPTPFEYEVYRLKPEVKRRASMGNSITTWRESMINGSYEYVVKTVNRDTNVKTDSNIINFTIVNGVEPFIREVAEFTDTQLFKDIDNLLSEINANESLTRDEKSKLIYSLNQIKEEYGRRDIELDEAKEIFERIKNGEILTKEDIETIADQEQIYSTPIEPMQTIQPVTNDIPTTEIIDKTPTRTTETVKEIGGINIPDISFPKPTPRPMPIVDPEVIDDTKKDGLVFAIITGVILSITGVGLWYNKDKIKDKLK